jgi:nitrite reductase/ring-hydroxylating ferredoxin subunit/uncharacterized membrane protein
MTTKSPAKPLEEIIQKVIDRSLYAGGRPSSQKIRNFLNGTWLGEPLHVVLKDVPIGAWTVAMLFDVFDWIGGSREFALAVEASIAIGILGAVGAAATGLTDWSDVDPPARKMGLLHGVLNVGATALFTSSLLLRRNNSRAGGRVAAALGYSLMTYSAHLGGKMVYKHRVGVDRTDGLLFPEKFTPVLPASELTEDQPTRAMHRGVPILLVRRGQRLFAMAETCSHFSGPLSQGKLVDGCIECPYHASRFALEDGRVINGPAVHPQPCLEVRIHEGQIEIRKPPCGTTARFE